MLDTNFSDQARVAAREAQEAKAEDWAQILIISDEEIDEVTRRYAPRYVALLPTDPDDDIPY